MLLRPSNRACSRLLVPVALATSELRRQLTWHTRKESGGERAVCEAMLCFVLDTGSAENGDGLEKRAGWGGGKEMWVRNGHKGGKDQLRKEGNHGKGTGENSQCGRWSGRICGTQNSSVVNSVRVDSTHTRCG